MTAWAVAGFGLIEVLHEPQAEHIDQAELVALVAAGEHHEAFLEAFEGGDELFETVFNLLDGVGANVGQGQRFSRVPRADLAGAGEWARHTPERATGPNAQACNHCHLQPFDDGAGPVAGNVHRDPTHSGVLSRFIIRNTPHVFAPGALQRLAEEMSEELDDRRDEIIGFVCRTGRAARGSLSAKGVDFGSLVVRPRSLRPCRVDVDTRDVRGVDPDLVIKPFQWKGINTSLRDFNRGAGHNELGMQAVEIVGHGVDGDFDGVVDEMTIGDMTGLAIYLAAQPRPVSKLELNALGLLEPPLTTGEVSSIQRGEQFFALIGCSGCHRPSLRIDEPIFSEPSQHAAYRDATFPAGQNPRAEGVDPRFAVTFDLTRDQPDNVIELPSGEEVRLGSFERDSQGRAIVRLYGDLRRHDMGPELAETIDEAGTGASVWITKELWGVGNTGPWLHDGRATTLTEAILFHGGEATLTRRAFEVLPRQAQEDIVAFLDSLVLFKVEEEG
jgi:hypothetical protein